ncbi:peptidoglycan-binding protein [Streptomyces sp. NPDC087903]|uniref:peptidoglycan-binding domain-containing protein n=1 Tax=Streptomyces sp. NPDC087903 TaxID=3365819 RepID=UPI0037FF35C3
MPTRPDREQPQDGPVLEPIHVLRPRRTDALAELFREFEQDGLAAYESVQLDRPSPGAEDATQELPPVTAELRYRGQAGRPAGRVRGRPRTVAVTVVAAAALIGFGCALLLPGRDDASAARPPAATASAEPTPTAPADSAAADPDGAGTLREGDSGPEVTDLQERLLRIPDVYPNGPTGGRYDAVLTEAVARFQLWYGIRGDEDGVYGDDTRLALESRTTQGDTAQGDTTQGDTAQGNG